MTTDKLEEPRTHTQDLRETYGHFAGENLEPEPSLTSIDLEKKHAQAEFKTPIVPIVGTAGVGRAVFLLIKAFVGTGILFLPRAFLNGGMIFSIVIMLIVAFLSLFSYLLLVETRKSTTGEGSFGGMAGTLFGWKMRFLVQFSIAFSQIGFVCAYMIFIAQNLHAFILNVTNCATTISIPALLFIQAIIFIPFALIRRIERLGPASLISEAFILFGIVYICYYDIKMVTERGLASDVKAFNPQDFALFIGTAVYSFEGIGLVIPITESMREPNKFPRVLWITLTIVTALFVGVGGLSYAAFGSGVQSIIVMNLPQGNGIVNAIQFLYACAIILSVPLQLFPAITILEKGSFGAGRSGRVSMQWKWAKNGFRAVLVMLCVMISWLGANDLDKFVSLIGSFACIPLCFIYPPMFHLKAVATKMWEKVADWALIVFGFGVMIYATYITILQWSAGGGEGLATCIVHG